MSKHRIFETRTSRRLRLTTSISARYIRNEDDRLELAVIVSDATTAEELREAWGAIDAARERLRSYQGTNFNSLTRILQLNMAAKKIRDGFSYAEVAMDVNYEVLINLSKALYFKQQGNGRDYLNMIQAAYAHLSASRMRIEDILCWLEFGLREISDGRSPWTLLSGPVEKQRVRDAIRQLEREIESKKVIVKQGPNTKKVQIADLVTTENRAPVETMDNLLSKEPESGGLERLRAAYARSFRRRVENSG